MSKIIKSETIKEFEPLFALNTGGGNIAPSDYFNNIRSSVGIERIFYMYFFNLVTNIFKWEDLPESCDSVYIENMLCLQGKCSFVNDKNNGLMSPQFTMKRKDWYGRASAIECIANNYTASFNDKSDFVIIRNTDNYIPTFLYIDYFVQQIMKIKAIADININAQKTPVVFEGTREQRELLKAEFEQYDGNAWYLFLQKGAYDMNALNTNAPFIADKLNDQIKFYTDMFLTFIGLNNANGTFKRERSLVDELQSNNEIIGITVDSMLKARQKACDEFNEKFAGIYDKKISVHYSDEVQKAQDLTDMMFSLTEQKSNETEGDEDE